MLSPVTAHLFTHYSRAVRPEPRSSSARTGTCRPTIACIRLSSLCASSTWRPPPPTPSGATDSVRLQLEEEIRLWWRTDELHQFKPSVLDEVDYALHYFQQVLFNAMPQLRRRIVASLAASYPDVRVPSASFCTFGSWVGSDRDGNPSVTTEITWRTACYQRQLMLDRYVSAVQHLRNQLSISMQWSQVSAPLLESLEMDRLRFPDVYEERATRYRLEPYRLKLSFVLERLRLT